MCGITLTMLVRGGLVFLFWGFGLRGWGNGGVTFRVLIAEGLVRVWAVGREDVWYRLEAMPCYARYLSGACRYDMHWPQCASCAKGCRASRAVWTRDTVDCVHLGGRGECLMVGFEGTKGLLRGVDLLGKADKGVAGGQVDSGHENGWDCVLRLFQVRAIGYEPLDNSSPVIPENKTSRDLACVLKGSCSTVPGLHSSSPAR